MNGPRISPPAEIALRTEGLTKRFGTLTAVDGLGFEVRRGEVVGLLGPNGAGKSTTIGMILGLIAPTTGRAEIAGRDVRADPADALANVGAIVEVPAFYPYLSGRDNLTALALIRGGGALARVEPALARVGLTDRARSPFRTYSLGMRQRLGIASTLLGDPSLVILDEPTNGLDPAGQREIRTLVRELASEGRAVLLASHLLYEVEQVCHKVLVIKKGRLIASGPIAEIVHAGSVYAIEVTPPAAARDAVLGLAGVESVTARDGGIDVAAQPGMGAALNRALVQAGLYADAIVPKRGSLEDVFLELTGEDADALPS
ncbi:MAG TPA: ABC transporter ATP-binding protein [Candidatus Limnocylindria bacterium]